MEMVREFEGRTVHLGHSSFIKGGAKYSEELGLQLQLKHPNPSCRANTGTIIEEKKIKTEKGYVGMIDLRVKFKISDGREVYQCEADG